MLISIEDVREMLTQYIISTGFQQYHSKWGHLFDGVCQGEIIDLGKAQAIKITEFQNQLAGLLEEFGLSVTWNDNPGSSSSAFSFLKTAGEIIVNNKTLLVLVSSLSRDTKTVTLITLCILKKEGGFDQLLN